MRKFVLTSVFLLMALIGVGFVNTGLLYVPVFLPVGVFLCLLGGRLVFLAIEKIRNLFCSLEREAENFQTQGSSVLWKILDGTLIVGLGFVIFMITIYGVLVWGMGHSFRGDQIYSEPVLYVVGVIIVVCIGLIFLLWRKYDNGSKHNEQSIIDFLITLAQQKVMAIIIGVLILFAFILII